MTASHPSCTRCGAVALPLYRAAVARMARGSGCGPLAGSFTSPHTSRAHEPCTARVAQAPCPAAPAPPRPSEALPPSPSEHQPATATMRTCAARVRVAQLAVAPVHQREPGTQRRWLARRLSLYRLGQRTRAPTSEPAPRSGCAALRRACASWRSATALTRSHPHREATPTQMPV